MRFGKEETGSEEKRLREQRGLVPSRPVLTRLRRPYLFSRKRKDRGEKSAWTRLVLSASEFRREPRLQASFHTIVTLRAFDYAPPDTGVSNLQLVALEQLLSKVQWRFGWISPSCGVVCRSRAPPLQGANQTKKSFPAKRCRPANPVCTFY